MNESHGRVTREADNVTVKRQGETAEGYANFRKRKTEETFANARSALYKLRLSETTANGDSSDLSGFSSRLLNHSRRVTNEKTPPLFLNGIIMRRYCGWFETRKPTGILLAPPPSRSLLRKEQ